MVSMLIKQTGPGKFLMGLVSFKITPPFISSNQGKFSFSLGNSMIIFV